MNILEKINIQLEKYLLSRAQRNLASMRRNLCVLYNNHTAYRGIAITDSINKLDELEGSLEDLSYKWGENQP